MAALLLGMLTVNSSVVCQTEAAAGDQRAQEAQLLKAVQQDPRSLQAVGALGEFYFRKQAWKQSAEWLDKAYALSGSDSSVGYDLAFALTRAGELERAKGLVGRMTAQNDSAKLHSLLGDIDDREGNYIDAAREYHRAAELDPSEPDIFDLATFLLQHKKYVGALDDSIKFFRYGVQKFPRSSRMMVGLGVALYAASEYDDAVRAFCAAIDLDPSDQRPIQFLGRASKVSPEMAIEVDRRLKGFAERYPDSAATNYFYALSLWERGGGEQGRERDVIERLLRKATTISPKWYEPHFELGVVYEAEERYPDAIAEMKKAVAIDPDFFPAHYRLSVLYNRSGNRTAAAAEAKLVKKLKAEDNEGASGHDITVDREAPE